MKRVLLRRMTPVELAELDDSVRRVTGLAERAWQEGMYLLWYVIMSHWAGWSLRLRIERWRAER